MTPRRCRIANADQHRLVLGSGPRKPLITPCIPINWIVGMLEQIWTGLTDKPVCEFFRAFHSCIVSRDFLFLKHDLDSVILAASIPMTSRCIAKLRPIKQRANLFAGD